MPDKKLADLTYKILHMILPCGDILSPWKLISVYYVTKRKLFLYLMYECNHAQASWDIIHKALNITISPEFIVWGGNDKFLNVVLSYF